MTKDEFITARTKIISKMLDAPSDFAIYPTTECFAELDDLFDKMQGSKQEQSGAQAIRDENRYLRS